MPKLLLCGDAGPRTGFEYVSNGFLRQLQARGWDVVQLGLNYNGDPHDYPWPVYRADALGDYSGANRLAEIIKVEKPDVLLLLNDSWGFSPYLTALERAKLSLPVVCYPPVDAPHQPHAAKLNGRCALVLTPTQFGADEMTKGGWEGRTEVVGYGIDVSQYGGISPLEARKALGMPAKYWDAQIVGNINRNAPRKRIDLTMEAFASLAADDRRHVYLLLHMEPRDPWGWDIIDLAKMYGVEDKIIMSGAKDYVSPERMRLVFACLDLLISTTVGEGWGLTTAEGMASRVVPVVPQYSALAEWADGGALYYRIADTQVAVGGMNTKWAIPDTTELTRMMEVLLDSYAKRTKYAARALQHISQEKFSWTAVGKLMDTALRSVL